MTVRDKYSGEVKRDRFKDRMKGNRLGMLHESYVDSMASLKALQDAIARESGSPILSFENAYWAENRMSSMNKAHMDKWHAGHFNPLMQTVVELTYKDKISDLYSNQISL